MVCYCLPHVVYKWGKPSAWIEGHVTSRRCELKRMWVEEDGRMVYDGCLARHHPMMDALQDTMVWWMPWYMPCKTATSFETAIQNKTTEARTIRNFELSATQLWATQLWATQKHFRGPHPHTRFNLTRGRGCRIYTRQGVACKHLDMTCRHVDMTPLPPPSHLQVLVSCRISSLSWHTPSLYDVAFATYLATYLGTHPHQKRGVGKTWFGAQVGERQGMVQPTCLLALVRACVTPALRVPWVVEGMTWGHDMRAWHGYAVGALSMQVPWACTAIKCTAIKSP